VGKDASRSVGNGTIGSMNQITSEVNYRTARGMASSDLAVVFKRVKDEIAEVICTDIPYGPMPEVSCVNHAPSCGREGATARHLLTRPIPELGVSIGDILCVDSLSGDVTVERKQ
jgi:hypothetical protein